MRVLHVLYQSLPAKVGSTIRSRDILTAQLEAGIEVFAATSPFQESVGLNEIDIINNVPYYRFPDFKSGEAVDEKPKSVIVQIKKLIKIYKFRKWVYKVAKELNVDIIHSHSTFFTGLAGAWAARKLGIPFFYEVRSLWEEHRVVVKASFKNKVLAYIIRSLENMTIRKACSVVVLNNELKQNLVGRGFNSSKFTVIMNAVNTGLIPFNKLNKPKRETLNLGYIGSIITIEGLDMLIDCVIGLQPLPVKLLIYGKGSQKEELEKIIAGFKDPPVQFRGEIQPSEVYKAYNEIDVIVNPRINNRITNDVTPLKPLEAMAYKTLVVASNVAGMKELITHEETGLLFEADNNESLKNTILQIYNKGVENYKDIIESAFEHVRVNRSWNKNAEIYKELYSKFLK